MVKFLDILHQYRSIKSEIDGAIANTIASGVFIGGPAVSEFEAAFAAYQSVRHCIGVGNGTDAIEIALEALELEPGSEVIVPANSFIASSEAVTRAGHRVVFCDCDPETYTLSPTSVREKITEKTRAIVAVHLYGQPCDMAELLQLAQEFDLKILEDCAQAHGAEYRNLRVGSFGDIATFSFYPGKNLGAYGDGGAIVTNSDALARKCRMIANHGRIDKYDHEFEGRNSRLDALQAAILSVKLRHLDSWIDARNTVASYYAEQLEGTTSITLPIVRRDVRHAFHLFVIRSRKRNDLQKHLKSCGIETGIHYPVALPKLRAYSSLKSEHSSFHACRIDSEVLSLPIGEHLQPEDLQRVVEAVASFRA